MARPTKLTPERQAKIIAALAAGNYFETSCRYAGIHPDSGYNWMVKGRLATSGIYFEFLRAVKEAEALAEVNAVAFVRLAFEGQWQSAMTWLERRFPDRWGRKDRIDLTVIDRELERARELFGLSDEEAERLKVLAVADAEAILKGGKRT